MKLGTPYLKSTLFVAWKKEISFLIQMIFLHFLLHPLHITYFAYVMVRQKLNYSETQNQIRLMMQIAVLNYIGSLYRIAYKTIKRFNISLQLP